MHSSVYQWVKDISPDCQPPILEVGSYNVNGTVRDHFVGLDYVGIDIESGPGVDQVYDGDVIPFTDGQFGTVISTEVFEHAANPNRLAAEIVRVMKPGGRAIITARGPGFQYHNPPDRWRYMQGALLELFTRLGCDGEEHSDWEAPGWFVEVTK